MNVIDIFDIPNVLSQMRSIVAKTPRQLRGNDDSSTGSSIPYSWLSGYSQLPMLVVLHSVTNKSGKQTLYPRMVTYNGSIVAELGRCSLRWGVVVHLKVFVGLHLFLVFLVLGVDES